MSQENVEVVRELFEAFRRNDVAAAVGHLDPAVEWYENPRGGFGDLRPVYHGYAGFREWVTQVGEVWEEAWTEPAEFIDGAGGRVICAYRLHARVRESDVPGMGGCADARRLRGITRDSGTGTSTVPIRSRGLSRGGWCRSGCSRRRPAGRRRS